MKIYASYGMAFIFLIAYLEAMQAPSQTQLSSAQLQEELNSVANQIITVKREAFEKKLQEELEHPRSDSVIAYFRAYQNDLRPVDEMWYGDELLCLKVARKDEYYPILASMIKRGLPINKLFHTPFDPYCDSTNLLTESVLSESVKNTQLLLDHHAKLKLLRKYRAVHHMFNPKEQHATLKLLIEKGMKPEELWYCPPRNCHLNY